MENQFEYKGDLSSLAIFTFSSNVCQWDTSWFDEIQSSVYIFHTLKNCDRIFIVRSNFFSTNNFL
jgi:hypothetical protein